MTAADVNVTELVARAVFLPYTGGDEQGAAYYDDEREWVQRQLAEDKALMRNLATAALDALRTPEVVAGIAGVLRDVRCIEDGLDQGRLREPKRREARLIARAVVDWLAGGGRP